MAENPKTGRFFATNASLIERFQAVLYPFPVESLLSVLPERGWIVPIAERKETTIQLSAPISKGEATLVFDMANKTLGVQGARPLEVLKAFREVRALAVGTFGLDPEVHTHYTELRYTGNLSGSMSPVESLARWWSSQQDDGVVALISARLPVGEGRLGYYGIRLAPVALDPNRPSWAELAIQPSPAAATNLYHFDLIYRHPSTETVEGVAETCEETVATAIQAIERARS
jgi:hypothetical protein